ncbi:MAG: hydrogenase maturation nickel metallochaperone HypA [Planctomycetaceae bacterium]
MHEESLARSLLQQTLSLCHRHNAQRVVAVRVSCGPLSGVEPSQLHEAFDRLKTTSPLSQSAALLIENPGLPARCENCKHQFSLVEFRFICPRCSSPIIQLLDGDCLRILDVELQTTDSINADSAVTDRNHRLNRA